MSDLPQSEGIKNKLHQKKRILEEELRELDRNELVSKEYIPEASDSATFSWMQDAQSGVLATKHRISDLYSKVKNSLSKLDKGTYGQCEKCNQKIDQNRLEIIPFATTCTVCIS